MDTIELVGKSDVTESIGKSDIVEDITPDGDVILVVGSRNIRLRVQSQCLRCASKAFGTMLAPDLSEGQRPSKEHTREVSLPKDNADALRTICCVIHHRNNKVPQALTPKEVLKIALVADKYDLLVALKYASAKWLEPRGTEGKVEMAYMVAASLVFGDMDTFAAHTLALILDYTGSYLELLDDEMISRIVPWDAFYLLEERRSRMRAEIDQLLIEGSNSDCSCGWGKIGSDEYKILHSRYKPLGMLEVPISDVVKKLETVSSEAIRGAQSIGNHYHPALLYGETILGKLETMKKKASICLDCLRSTDAVKPCRFKHE